jgi:hypothetical protein
VGTETLALALSAAAAIGLSVATHDVATDRALALGLLVLALGVALAAPLASLSREKARRAVAGFLGFALVLVVAAAVRHGPTAGVAAAVSWIFLHGVVLALVTRGAATRLGDPGGVALGLALSLFFLGAPYVTGDLVSALPRGGKSAAMSMLLLLSPSVVLPGTFLGIDAFREEVLYRLFRPSQDVDWTYASPAFALLGQAALVVALLAAGRVTRRLRARKPSVAPALLLVLLAASSADALVTSGGAPPTQTPAGDIGPLNVKIRLSYIVPFIEGNFKVTGFTPGVPPSRLDLVHDLDLSLQYAIPAFEVDVGWPGAGRIWLEYWEADFNGNLISPPFEGVAFKNLVVPPDDVGIVDYRFRTISLNGRLDIPIVDWLTLELIVTGRYAHWQTTFRVPEIGAKEVANYDTILPALGPGFDFFIIEQIYAYGSLEWLDFSLGIGGRSAVYHYTEIHGGLRVEIIQSAHFGLEFYMLEVGVTDDRHSYRQRILGPRVWVEVQF